MHGRVVESHILYILKFMFCLCSSSSNIHVFFLYYQGPVVPQTPSQMDKEGTPAPLLGAESLTPVTQGTGGLQVLLVEHVSQMACGQGVILLVPVSHHHCKEFSIDIYVNQFH